MDSLRLALLIIGCVIITGIYFWGILSDRRFQKNRQRHDLTDSDSDNPAVTDAISNQAESSDDDLVQASDPAVDTPFPLPLKEDNEQKQTVSIPPMRAGFYDDQPGIQDVPVINPRQYKITEHQHSIDASFLTSQELVTLYIISLENMPFDGVLLHQAADAVGMVFGYKHIFHHFGDGQFYPKQPLFSMANIHEPGSFEPTDRTNLKTDGVVLFLYLQPSIDINAAFELFLHTAEQLAKLLHAQVCTITNEPLSKKAVQSLRSQVNDFFIHHSHLK